MTSVPKTMKAWVNTGSSPSPAALELKTHWPTPASPTGDDILLKVSHVPLNPLDLIVIGFPTKGRLTGADFAGEIVQAGPNVSSSFPDLRVGMVVCGSLPPEQIFASAGTLAEYIVVPASVVAEKPAGVDAGAASALIGVPGQTTVHLMREAKLSKGDRVLVNGASGGVGCIAVQVLKANGIHVTAICSGKNEAMVRALGAAEVVDYTAEKSLYDTLSQKFGGTPFDSVWDLVGDLALYSNSPGYLKPEGKILCIASHVVSADLPPVQEKTPRTFVAINNLMGAAKEVASWVVSGTVKEIPIESTFDMNDAKKAFEKLALKRTKGKIVVKVA